MRDVILVRALNMTEEPALEQVHDLQRAVHSRFSDKTGFQLADPPDQIVMLAQMNPRVGVSGFGEELLFMGKVNADVPDQPIEYTFERLFGPPGDSSVVQFADENRQFLMVVIQQLHLHAHAVRPDNERRPRQVLSRYFLVSRSK